MAGLSSHLGATGERKMFSTLFSMLTECSSAVEVMPSVPGWLSAEGPSQVLEATRIPYHKGPSLSKASKGRPAKNPSQASSLFACPVSDLQMDVKGSQEYSGPPLPPYFKVGWFETLTTPPTTLHSNTKLLFT